MGNALRGWGHISLKERVFAELEKNSTLSPSILADVLGLDFKKHGRYLRKLKHSYKCYLKNRQALKCLKFHDSRGWVFAPRFLWTNADDSPNVELARLNRQRAVAAGWQTTNAKNRMLLFKGDVAHHVGRLEWFETGRVNIWINKPATWNRVKQLLAYGFLWTKLIDDSRKGMEFFEVWSKTARFKGAHLVYDTGVPLPYAKVDLLKDSNGAVVKLGDESHKTCLEIEYNYPDWGERNERLLEQTTRQMETMQRNFQETLKSMADVLKLSTEQLQTFGQFMQEFTAPKRLEGEKKDSFFDYST